MQCVENLALSYGFPTQLMRSGFTCCETALEMHMHKPTRLVNNYLQVVYKHFMIVYKLETLGNELLWSCEIQVFVTSDLVSDNLIIENSVTNFKCISYQHTGSCTY